MDLTLWRRYRAAQTGITAAHAQEMTAREESVLLVVSQYLGCQRAAADVEAAQARETLAQALYDQAADLQKNGVGTGIDTLRANVQLQNEKQRVIVTHTQLETGAVRAGPPVERRSAAKNRAGRPGAILRNARRLRRSNPGARLRHASRAAPDCGPEAQAQLALKAAEEERLPKLTVSGDWSEQGLTPTSVIPVYQYQASLDVPLFTGGRIEAERAKVEIRLRQLKQQEQAAHTRSRWK